MKMLILGASYGSLLSTKLLMAGHDVTLICRSASAALINSEGTEVRIKLRDEDTHRAIRSADLPGSLNAVTPEQARPEDYDMIALAMQEPQYSSPGVRDLLQAVAKSGVPCMSIMNMPPLSFMKRLPNMDVESLRVCYAESTVWDAFDPEKFTLCSPDPQAFRPPEENLNVLQVRLPTNFKAAAFHHEQDNAMLRRLQADIEAVRFTTDDGAQIELPVKLKVHDSVFVPLAKWAMLVAGNYRCVQKEEMRPIQDAVHHDLEQSREIYNWVVELCIGLGGASADFVPFKKYANAAQSLGSPSSAARALAAGAKNIERVDKLAQTVAAKKGAHLPSLDETVALVDGWLEKNRAAS